MTTVLAVALFSIWPFSNEQIKQEVETIHIEAKSHFKADPDRAVALVQLALLKSEEANYSYGQAKSLLMIGSAAQRQGKPALATTHFLNALQVYEALNHSESLSDQAKIYLEMGKIFWHHHRTQEAIDQYKQGLALALQSKQNDVMVKLLHNMAVAHRTGKDYGTAITLLMKKLDFIDPNNAKEKMHTYNELGLQYQNLKEYKNARQWFGKMLETDTTELRFFFRGQALHNLANIEKEIGNYTEAWDLFNQALSEKVSPGNAKTQFITYQDMAGLALLEKQPELALTYAEKATPLLAQVPDTPKYFDQYDLLSHCHEEKNPRKALSYSRMYEERQRSFNQTQKNLISKIEGYKLDLVLANHEKQLQQQTQQRKLTYTIISLLLLSLMIYVYMDYRKRKYRLYLIDQISFFIKDGKLLKKL